MLYKHTQIGYLIIIISLAVLFLFGFIFLRTDAKFLVLFFMFFIIFLLASFATLQVIVNESYVQVKFGYGIFKKKFKLSEIESIKIVRNHWYYGWGIRLWLWPKMWIYNVSGLDAVELIMKDSKIYRIGTDEPKKLEQTIDQAIK